MNRIILALGCAAFVAASGWLSASVAASGSSQQAGAQQDIKLKKDEFDAFKAVENATGIDAKFVAAKAFTAKFPSSAAADSVEQVVADAIAAAPTDPKFATYVADFKALYPASTRGGNLQILLLDQFVSAGDWASSSKVGEEYLSKWPDDVRVHFRLLEVGLEAAKKQDGSLVPSANKHGVRAVELFKADTRPPGTSDADWATYKQRFLPKALQSLGLLAYVTANFDGAEAHLKEAATLNPTDPFNHFFLGAVAETRYRDVAEKFNALPQKDKGTPEAKKLVEQSAAREDELIGHFVKVMALADGKPEFSQLVSQAKPALEEHYKHRHNNSLDGLDAMIAAAKGGQ
jgi:hypothetical protein